MEIREATESSDKSKHTGNERFRRAKKLHQFKIDSGMPASMARYVDGEEVRNLEATMEKCIRFRAMQTDAVEAESRARRIATMKAETLRMEGELTRLRGLRQAHEARLDAQDPSRRFKRRLQEIHAVWIEDTGRALRMLTEMGGPTADEIWKLHSRGHENDALHLLEHHASKNEFIF